MAIEKRHPTITGGTIVGGGLTWDLPENKYPNISQAMDDISYEKLNREILEKQAQAKMASRSWLDDTQNMRVVALNEACGLAKAMGANVDSQTIVRMASVFSDYLINDRV